MAPVFRRLHRSSAWLFGAGAIVGGAAFLTYLGLNDLARHRVSLPPDDEVSPSGMVPAAAPVRALSGTTVFAAGQPADAEADPGALSERFRLAGTFFVMSADLQPATRKAVLVDRQAGQDIIVQEGDRLADHLTVLEVASHHILLDYHGKKETIELTTGTGLVARNGLDTETTVMANGARASRFGSPIAENRWVFERDQLIAYYQEVMQSPRRLKQVFDSMKPLYDDNNRITGYQLDIEGEPDFFHDVGLRQGDVIRHVNDMAMSSRLRAEYLIREFVYDRLNVFVIDIERDNESKKLIYEVR